MYPSLLAFFKEQVFDHGIESTVAKFLPEFVSSIAMDAFHPIIRLGYAIDFQSPDETAAALAYLVSWMTWIYNTRVPTAVNHRNFKCKQVLSRPVTKVTVLHSLA